MTGGSGDSQRLCRGRQTELKDPLNIVTTTEYEDGRVSQSIDGKGATTQYSYDAVGNLVGLTDPASNTSTWVYDKLRRPVQETNQLGKSRTFKYDLNGNLVERVDRTGKKILYTYDKLNQPIKETWVNDTTGVGEYNYSYQTLGKIQTAHSGAVSAFDRDQVSFAYTADGRLKQETQQWKEITSELATVNYEYLGTQSGPATVLTNYAGTTQLINSYSYNSLGEVTQIKQESPQATVARFRSVDYSRNLLGQTTQLTRKYGMTSVPNTLAPVTNYSYDGADRIQNIQHINGNASLASYAYTYDLASRITSINSLLDSVVTYAYDNANQVTQATYGMALPNPLNERVTGAVENSAGNITSEVFAYDSNGNNTSLAIGSNSQMTGDGVYTYTYDDEGRPISRSSGAITTTYAWDHRGRLVSVMEDHGGTPVAGAVDGVSVEYRYDAFDRRIFKDVGQTVWFDMCVVAICQPGVTMLVPQHAPGAQRYYVYDGQHIAVELLNITDDGSASGDVAKRFMHGASIDEVLGEEHLGQFQWTFGDHLGTIRDSLTISGSSTHYVYSTFGQLLTGSALTFGYTGRETDSDTLLADNWMYYRARYYDSHTGRFVSQDPIGFNAGDANLYRCVGNGPVDSTDPSGLKDPQLGDNPNPLAGIPGITPADQSGSLWNPFSWWDWRRGGRAEAGLEAMRNARVQSETDIFERAVALRIFRQKQLDTRKPYIKEGAEAAINFTASGGEFVCATSGPVLARRQFLDDIGPVETRIASAKASQRVPVVEHVYLNPGHHVKGTRTYIRGKQLLPENHLDLFNQSVVVFDGDGRPIRWAREGSGNNAVYHRFAYTPGQGNNPAEYHWSGSTCLDGVDAAGKARYLRVSNDRIPTKEIDKLLDKPWWRFW